MRADACRPHIAVAMRLSRRGGGPGSFAGTPSCYIAGMDWSACPDVESIPDKLSGAWVVTGTRVPADAIAINAKDGYALEQIVADLFPTVSLEAARRILEFVAAHEPHPT